MLILSIPLIFLVKPRLPVPCKSEPHIRVSYAFVKSRTFLFFQLCIMLESLGYNLPPLYLPRYALSVGLSPIAGTVILAAMNSFSIVGAVGTGYLCDRLHVTTVVAISTAGSTLSIFFLWGLATDFPILMIFAVFYGTFVGGFSTIWSSMIREVRIEDRQANLGMLGLFSAGRGIGAVLSGPLSVALLKGSPLKGQLAMGYGTGYGGLIIFTGISAFLGLVCFGVRTAK
jgi:MFS family permease